MKTKLLTVLLLLFAIMTQAQNSEKITSIGFRGIENYDLVFAVYTTILGGIDDYTVEYDEDENNNLIVNILCSQSNPTDSYSEVITTFSTDSDLSYGRATISVKVRSKIGGTEEFPQYGDYRIIGSIEIPLDNPHRINALEPGRIKEDSLDYIVQLTTSIIGDWSVEYEDDGSSTVNVNIIVTETGHILCYCPFSVLISLRKDTYNKAIVTVEARHRTGGTQENPVFSDRGLLCLPRAFDLRTTGTATHNTPADNEITITPNPVGNMLYVDLKTEEKADFKIYNLQGSLLLNTSISGSRYIDVSFLNSGLYVVVIDNKYFSKLIKQ